MKSQLISLLVIVSTGLFFLSGCGSNLIEPEQPLAMKGITDELPLTGDVTAMHDSMLQYPTMPYIEGIAVGILTPIFGKPGSLVQIHGLNFGYSGDSIKVMFENINVEVVSVNPRTITVKAPDKLGSAKVIVTKGIYTAVSPQRFTITNESIFLTSMEFELKGVEFEIESSTSGYLYPDSNYSYKSIEKNKKDIFFNYEQQRKMNPDWGDCSFYITDFSGDTISLNNNEYKYGLYFYSCNSFNAFFIIDTIEKKIRKLSVIQKRFHDYYETPMEETNTEIEISFVDLTYQQIKNEIEIYLDANELINKMIKVTYYYHFYYWTHTATYNTYEKTLGITIQPTSTMKLILTRE